MHCAAKTTAAAAGTQGPPAQGRIQGRAQAAAGPAQAATVLGLDAYDSDLDDEGLRHNNAAEEQAAKRAKLPTVNPFASNFSAGEFTGSVLGWYKNHSGEIGAWAEASLIAFSFTPSSAAAERVFSLLKALFGSSQDMALADYAQGSMMVRYNGSKRGTSF